MTFFTRRSNTSRTLFEGLKQGNEKALQVLLNKIIPDIHQLGHLKGRSPTEIQHLIVEISNAVLQQCIEKNTFDGRCPSKEAIKIAKNLLI